MKKIDLTSWNISSATSLSGLLQNCNKLKYGWWLISSDQRSDISLVAHALSLGKISTIMSCFSYSIWVVSKNIDYTNIKTANCDVFLALYGKKININ